eukprot:8830190-Pyramimonas_sp.AAC.1
MRLKLSALGPPGGARGAASGALRAPGRRAQRRSKRSARTSRSASITMLRSGASSSERASEEKLFT